MSHSHVIQRLTQLETPDEAEIANILGVELVQHKERAHTRFLAAESPPSPYSRVELKLGKDEPKGHLVLGIAPDQRIAHDALVLPDYGEPTIDVNPRVPPEGVVTEHFAVGAVDLAFQGTAKGHQLRLISLRWTP